MHFVFINGNRRKKPVENVLKKGERMRENDGGSKSN
jgi:hypothetical protein